MFFFQIFSAAVLLGFIKSVAISDTFTPTAEILQSWWKKDSTEKMTVDGDLIPITLKSKEQAFLAPVYISRGRNDSWHTALLRPMLMEIHEIGHPVRRDSKVLDLDHDGISEIESVSLGSGQGTTHGEKSIVQIEDWKPIILHRKEFYGNLGCCGPPEWGCGKCVSQEVKWEYVDLDNDGKDDLIEEVIIKEGSFSNKINVKKKITRKYLFKNNKLIPKNDKQINVTILRHRLLAAGVSPSIFSIDGDQLPEKSGGVLDRVTEYWRIREYDSGNFTNDLFFVSETEACAYFFDETMPFYVPWDNRNFFKQRYHLEW